MTKIGILTFHWADNYGALLQCYALKEYLAKKGYDVSVINYWPQYALIKRATRIGSAAIKKQFGVDVKPNWKLVFKNIVLGRVLSAKRSTEKMDLFRIEHIVGNQKKYLTYAELQENINQFEILISGSDQIWNPNITGGTFDKSYFLSFESCASMKVAYAASLGVKFQPEWKNDFKALLSQYHFISAREKSLACLINTECDKLCKSVVDPVFLLEKKDWECLVTKNIIKEHYIFVYVLQRDTRIVSMANWLSQKTKLPIHILGARRPYRKATYIKGGVIEEFINQIKNADYVLTNSFHGTAFSLIFQRRFLAFLDSLKPTRIIDLLTDIGMEKYIYNSNNREVIFDEPDYNQAYNLMNIRIRESEEYIDNCISVTEDYKHDGFHKRN